MWRKETLRLQTAHLRFVYTQSTVTRWELVQALGTQMQITNTMLHSGQEKMEN